MKIPQGMKTKLGGSLFAFSLCIILFATGVATGLYFSEKKFEEQYHLLPKEYYDCWVGMLLPDEQQTKVCIVYRAKGINFEENNLPRHREYNKEQGKRIHEF